MSEYNCVGFRKDPTTCRHCSSPRQECPVRKCSTCSEMLTQCILDCHGGMCVNCTISGGCREEDYEYQEEVANAVREKDCERCGKKLIPIGNSREKGADHDDWHTRKYHKKCWKEMKYAEIDE